MRSIVLACAALMVAAEVAGADEPAEAEKLFVEGQAAFDANRFDEAVSAWERSYELSKEPGLLFNIGQAYRQRRKPGDCAKALEAYQEYMKLDRRADQRTLAEGFAAEMRSCAASEAPTTTAEPRSEPPIAGSDEGTSGGRTKRIAGLAIAGGGVALVVTSFYFGHRASSLGDEVTDACNEDNGCDWAVFGPKDADGRSAQTKHYVFGGLGLAAIFGGALVYWLGSREAAPAPIAITPRRDGAALTWSGSW